jgi:hypothetical protein
VPTALSCATLRKFKLPDMSDGVAPMIDAAAESFALVARVIRSMVHTAPTADPFTGASLLIRAGAIGDTLPALAVCTHIARYDCRFYRRLRFGYRKGGSRKVRCRKEMVASSWRSGG